MDEFSKYAIKHRGINSLTLEKYRSIAANYISPTIIEERQLNIATMDVFFAPDDGPDHLPGRSDR